MIHFIGLTIIRSLYILLCLCMSALRLRVLEIFSNYINATEIWLTCKDLPEL